MNNEPNLIEIIPGGGLNLIDSTGTLFKMPGYATVLKNFESSERGGYRRINGYTMFGDTLVNGYDNELLGVYPYADGIVACISTDVYFSTDGTTWTQVNTDTWNSGNGQSDPSAHATLSRAGQSRNYFVVYEGDTDYGDLIMCDGVNEMALLRIEGSGGGRTYAYREVTSVEGAPAAPAWAEVYKDHVILGGDVTFPQNVYWSDAFTTDSFTGGTAGSIELTDKITGIKSWRDRLFIFSQHSINEVIDINGTVSVNNVTRNVGCINGFSIQEAAGDVLYLSIDGIRTLAGTDKIDDLELGNISRNVDPILKTIVNDIANLNISSITIRSKNQYRLYYTKSSNDADLQKGIIGTLIQSQEGLRWEWSEVFGIPVACASSAVVANVEKIYHGGFDGYVYQHDIGNDYNSSNIKAYYQTPEINYGNIGFKKTLYWMRLSLYLEGAFSEVYLDNNYDFSSSLTHQPPNQLLSNTVNIATYGTAVYGTDVYGAPASSDIRINLNGSGYSNSFQFFSQNTIAPYTIQTMFIKYHEGKLQ